jgi:sugar phosphate isomerase/epimerase
MPRINSSAGTDRLSIEFISGLGLPPAQFVALAARLGCRAIGLAPTPITGPLAGQESWTLRDNPALQAELKTALSEHGVTISLGEGFLIMPGRAIANAQADIAMMAELGAARLNVVVLEPDRPRALEEFGQFAEMAHRHGLPVTVEFMPAMALASLSQSLDFLRDVAAANAGVMVDAMHLFASGGTVAELAAAPPELILYAQLCDARLAGFYDGYFDDARCNRPAPGTGVLPLADFVAALPAACPIGLELPMLALAETGTPLDALLSSAIATARALLAAHSETVA